VNLSCSKIYEGIGGDLNIPEPVIMDTVNTTGAEK
jgi:hypothetical protein